MSDDAILREARDAFTRATDYELVNRKEAREDIEFARLSKQWNEKVKAERELQGRPCLTINKLAPVIRQVVNDARQNRPSIKVMPKDDKADIETAEVISGLIRNIEQTSNADVAYDTAIDAAVSGGFGYWRVDLEYSYGGDLENYKDAGSELFEQDICIKRIANQFSVYGDPDGMEADSSDWMRAFVIEMMPHAKFKAKYKTAKMADFESSAWSIAGASWKTDSEVMVAEYWKREEVSKLVVAVQTEADLTIMDWADFDKLKQADPKIEAVTKPRAIKCYKVTQYLMTGVEVLETNEWPGTFIPIVPVYGDEVNFEGNRHFRSLIRDAKDANRMFNYWRTKATEAVALAPLSPFIGKKGVFEYDAAKWATANTQNHAYIEYEGAEPPMRQPYAGVPAGALQEALNASDDIKAITGIFDASLGNRSNETSGRAIRERKMEGDVSTYHFIDNLTRAIRHTGKIIIDLIPKVYSTERVVRILGEDGTPETKKINGNPDEMQDEGQEQSTNIRIHDLRLGSYDLAVTAGPSFTTRREESAEQMIELIRSFPDAAPVIGDLLAKNLDWPGADEIAKRLEKMLPPGVRDDESGDVPPEIQTQLKQMSEALQVMGQRLQDAESKRDIEVQKLGVERYKAETERMTAVAPAMGPNEIQAIVLQTLQDLMSPNELPDAEGFANGPTGQPEPEFAAA